MFGSNVLFQALRQQHRLLAINANDVSHRHFYHFSCANPYQFSHNLLPIWERNCPATLLRPALRFANALPTQQRCTRRGCELRNWKAKTSTPTAMRAPPVEFQLPPVSLRVPRCRSRLLRSRSKLLAVTPSSRAVAPSSRGVTANSSGDTPSSRQGPKNSRQMFKSSRQS